MTAAVRQAGPADVDTCVALLGAQLAEHDLGSGNDRPAIEGALANPSLGAIFLAEEAGTALAVAYVGWFWSIEHGGASAWLDELYVIPSRRGAGLGSLVLAAVESAARARGCVAVDLEVEDSHERAAALYLRTGFRPLPRRRFVKRL
ncbi:MAG TPA: GNAT family N-acetyltransferase [Tepidisphaeraceae bacterium]|nr:GNAT family N-acetyltransferase [Tepidisphaeraceae bacterium]